MKWLMGKLADALIARLGERGVEIKHKDELTFHINADTTDFEAKLHRLTKQAEKLLSLQ